MPDECALGSPRWHARQLRALPGWQLDAIPDDLMLEASFTVIARSADTADALAPQLRGSIEAARRDAFLDGYAVGMDHTDGDGKSGTAVKPIERKDSA